MVIIKSSKLKRSKTPYKYGKKSNYKFLPYYTNKDIAREMIDKGVFSITDNGYTNVTYKGHNAFLHRLVLIANNVKIPKWYTIHHIDGNKNNNNFDNLEALPRCEHNKKHKTGV